MPPRPHQPHASVRRRLQPRRHDAGHGRMEGRSSTIIWDAATGEHRRVLTQIPEQELWGRSVDFSPDGRLVAGEGWDDVFVWSVEAGRIVARMQEQQVTALAFSPDGRRLGHRFSRGKPQGVGSVDGTPARFSDGKSGTGLGSGVLSGRSQPGHELYGRDREAVGRWHWTADAHARRRSGGRGGSGEQVLLPHPESGVPRRGWKARLQSRWGSACRTQRPTRAFACSHSISTT